MTRICTRIVFVLAIGLLFSTILQAAQAVESENASQIEKNVQPIPSNLIQVNSDLDEVNNLLIDNSLTSQSITSPSLISQPVPFSAEPLNVTVASATATDTKTAVASQKLGQQISIAAIPEPSSWILLTLGAAIALAFGFILRQHSVANS